MLINVSTGKIEHARFGSRFMFSLVNNDIHIEAGKYHVMIDPIWHESVHQDAAFSDVLLDFYAPEQLPVAPLDWELGFDVLKAALVTAATT